MGRLLRPLLAFSTLCLAAFLLAPTVASVHDNLEELHVERDLPWELWEWNPQKPPVPGCDKETRHLYSEVTQWPARIEKDQPFTVKGVVQSEENGRAGVGPVEVFLYLNATKSEPGVELGKATSDAGGVFILTTSVPFELEASRYHLVAHAIETRIDCYRYLEHWSDPEMEVVSDTHIEWDDPGILVVGKNTTLSGELLDEVDAPVRNATVELTVDGKTRNVRTTREGRFSIDYTPTRVGRLPLVAEFKGSQYYDDSRGNVTYEVQAEHLEIEAEPTFLRSQPTPFAGHVYVAEPGEAIQLRFLGLEVATCASCEPSSNVSVPLDASGGFSVDLVVPSTAEPGVYKLTVTGGGLKKAYVHNATVEVQPVLTLEAEGTSLFGKGYSGRVVLTDEVGRPMPGVVTIATILGEERVETDEEGAYAFGGEFPECGSQPIVAEADGEGHVRNARAREEVVACAFLAYLPPWLLAVPWWVWLLAALATGVGLYVGRSLRQVYASTIVGGPALTLTFTEPSDEAIGYAGIHEPVIVSAYLEEPLPDGHRLRMGTHRATSETPLDAELRAHLRIVPEKLGDLPIRAEILDPKGRIVTRRTVTLHVVKYAQEIEKRYLRLRAESGADESVTPREFEQWLHERAPGLDPEVARRLVRVFEEADYSPRVAGRAEFAAYLAAEGGVKEVSADAMV